MVGKIKRVRQKLHHEAVKLTQETGERSWNSGRKSVKLTEPGGLLILKQSIVNTLKHVDTEEKVKTLSGEDPVKHWNVQSSSIFAETKISPEALVQSLDADAAQSPDPIQKDLDNDDDEPQEPGRIITVSEEEGQLPQSMKEEIQDLVRGISVPKEEGGLSPLPSSSVSCTPPALECPIGSPTHLFVPPPVVPCSTAASSVPQHQPASLRRGMPQRPRGQSIEDVHSNVGRLMQLQQETNVIMSRVETQLADMASSLRFRPFCRLVLALLWVHRSPMQRCGHHHHQNSTLLHALPPHVLQASLFPLKRALLYLLVSQLLHPLQTLPCFKVSNQHTGIRKYLEINFIQHLTAMPIDHSFSAMVKMALLHCSIKIYVYNIRENTPVQ
ncbi:uncharacterized protein LOC121322889 isoform X1 [Polyodon spathula]|uniref:uncharacterized protein LOC121322889 isoform X1 n=1 Tax=Polyodon spathula TaxID=7913 RepID=UPI001B7EE970|nr:uncharacterized protein LOC121322889 isoform X1 [Polyodon spathula]